MTETKTTKKEKEEVQEVQQEETTLIQKLSLIQRELKAPKNQYNSFGKYYYRNCEDIMEAVKPFLNDLILTVSDEMVIIGDRYYVKATALLIDNTEKSISNTAFARESETKAGMDAAQITGAASSYARKYALNGLFAIDDTKDADSSDNSTKKPVSKPVAKAPVKQNAVGVTDEDIAATFDGKLPLDDIPNPHMDERTSFVDEGTIVRDTTGHTACKACGKVVDRKVEEYSLKKYNKVLCYDCQKKGIK